MVDVLPYSILAHPTETNIYFLFMTLVYITVLDTFTPYNAEMAIIRTVICGFLMMGILAFYRQLEKEDIEAKTSKLSKWMIL